MRITRRQIRRLVREATLSDQDKSRLEDIVSELEAASEKHAAQAEKVQDIVDNSDDEATNESLAKIKISRRQIGKIVREALVTEAGQYYSRMPKSGPMAEVGKFFEELGGGMWKYKLTSQGGNFQLPTGDNPDLGYFVIVEHNRGIYKMKWIQRVKTNEYPYVKVIRPQNGWEVDSIPRDIKNAVDEIIYDIARHEAEPKSWSPGAGNSN